MHSFERVKWNLKLPIMFLEQELIEPHDYSTGHRLPFQAVTRCLAVRESGEAVGGPRCQFKLEKDSVSFLAQ